MKRISIYSILLALAFMYAVDVFSQTQFSRNLSLGSQGEDVKILQQLLNQDTKTRLSTSGVGSLGLETTYFGPLTHNAVVRFQNIYASEILAPIGLSYGTGFVGVMTRDYINTAFIDPSSTFLSQIQFENDSNGPTIFSVSPTSAGIGTEVTITGKGFLPTGNTIVTVFEEYNDISSGDGRTLKFVFEGPDQTILDLEENQELINELKLDIEYQVIVRNKNGISNAIPFILNFYE